MDVGGSDSWGLVVTSNVDGDVLIKSACEWGGVRWGETYVADDILDRVQTE